MKKFWIPIIVVVVALTTIWVHYYYTSPVVFEVAPHVKYNMREWGNSTEQEVEPISALIIKAPETCRVGQMVTIDVTGSTADEFEWLVIPATDNFRVDTNNREALFSAEAPGTFIFIIAATRDGILLPISQITIVVELGIAPPPDISDDFTIKVKGWLPSNADPVILEKLAKSFERVASAGHKEVADLVKTTALSNRAILGPSLLRYKTFLVAFSTHLKVNLSEATIDEHVELWFSLAAALRSIK